MRAIGFGIVGNRPPLSEARIQALFQHDQVHSTESVVARVALRAHVVMNFAFIASIRLSPGIAVRRVAYLAALVP